MKLWTLFSLLTALVTTVPLQDTRLVVVRHDDYIIQANVAVEKTDVQLQESLVYHYFHRGRIVESQGDFTGNLLEGVFEKLLVDNTLIEKGTFSNGLKDGNWKSWYDNGVLGASELWRQGRQDGDYTYYDATGQPMESGSYKEGQKDGKVLMYKSGELYETIAYKMGKEIFKARKKTTSQAYGPKENEDAKAPASILDAQPSDIKTALKKVSLYYTDKANTQPIPNVSVVIMDHQTGDMQRKVSDAGGQIDFEGALGSYTFSASLPPYQEDVANVSIVADEQHVWIELEKEKACAPMVYDIINDSGQTILSETEVRLINLSTGQKESLFTSQGRIEPCLNCGNRYQVQLFNDGHEYLETQLILDADCNRSGSGNQWMMKAIEVAPKRDVVNRITPTITYDPGQANITSVGPTNEERPIVTTPPSNHTTETASVGKGEYYVVVGTFTTKDNADKRLKQVQSAGYDRASMLRDQSSGLWSVYVQRFDAYDAAKAKEREVERAGIFKTFVKILE